MNWEIITGEYPPQSGGVADYTRSIAVGLASYGDRVRVWTTSCSEVLVHEAGVDVRQLESNFSLRGLRALAGAFDGSGPVVVQYVPHAFGWKAMNIPFCFWLWLRRKTQIWVVYHEVAVPFSWHRPFITGTLALAHWFMCQLVAKAASRIWITIPAWEVLVRSAANRATPIECLPVTSAATVVAGRETVKRTKLNVTGHKGVLIGHFGAYRQENTDILRIVLPELLRQLPVHVTLIGGNSEEFRNALVDTLPELAQRITATGRLDTEVLSEYLSACDVMIQPYPDGVSGRRTSVMACLAHSCAVVTNTGPSTEAYWRESRAVALAEREATWSTLISAARSVLTDDDYRTRLKEDAARLYQLRFDIGTLIATLRTAAIADANRLV